MEICLDITAKCNEYIDTFSSTKEDPILFLNFPSNIVGEYSFEIMNFSFILRPNVQEQFKKNYTFCKDVIDCNFEFASLFVFGKAKVIIEGVKGADIIFNINDNYTNPIEIYHNWDYNIVDGDCCYLYGGYSSFTRWFANMHIITNQNHSVKIIFSSDDYILVDTFDDTYALSKGTKYEYSNSIGKSFFNDYFLKKSLE